MTVHLDGTTHQAGAGAVLAHEMGHVLGTFFSMSFFKPRGHTAAAARWLSSRPLSRNVRSMKLVHRWTCIG